MRISDWSSDVCSSDLRLKIGGNAGMAGRTTGMAKSEAVATESIDGKAERDAPLIDLNGTAIKKLIARAKKRGVITYDELNRSEEHTSELQSLMRISYAVFCLKKKTTQVETNMID